MSSAAIERAELAAEVVARLMGGAASAAAARHLRICRSNAEEGNKSMAQWHSRQAVHLAVLAELAHSETPPGPDAYSAKHWNDRVREANGPTVVS